MSAPAPRRRSARRRRALAAAAAAALAGLGVLALDLPGAQAENGRVGVATATVPPTRTRLVVMPGVAGRVTVVTDLRYASASPSEVLDLLLPPHAGRRIPLVIYIHGGAFLEGDKAESGPVAQALLRSGYAVASINYRMTGEARYPAAVQDAKAAVRRLRADARTYGLRPDRFAVWGESAGGYLAAMVGATGSQRTVFDAPQLGHATTSSAVQAVVDEYGPTDFLTMDADSVDPGGCPGDWWMRHDEPDSADSRWLGGALPSIPAVARAASPLTYVARAARGTLPAFAIDHGDEDCTVPYAQSLALVRALRARKAPVSFTLVPGAGHSDDRLHDLMTPPIVRWLHTVLDRR